MKPLPKDLQTPKKSLDDFYEVTKRVLGHLHDIVSERVTARDYIILSSVVAGTSKYARPINNNYSSLTAVLSTLSTKNFSR